MLNQEMDLWRDRIHQLIEQMPTAAEDEIGWRLVEEISRTGAELLKPKIAGELSKKFGGGRRDWWDEMTDIPID